MTLKVKVCGPAVISIVLNVSHSTTFTKVYCIQRETGSNMIRVGCHVYSVTMPWSNLNVTRSSKPFSILHPVVHNPLDNYRLILRDLDFTDGCIVSSDLEQGIALTMCPAPPRRMYVMFPALGPMARTVVTSAYSSGLVAQDKSGAAMNASW